MSVKGGPRKRGVALRREGLTAADEERVLEYNRQMTEWRARGPFWRWRVENLRTTQRAMASELGIGTPTLQSWEWGQTPSPEKLGLVRQRIPNFDHEWEQWIAEKPQVSLFELFTQGSPQANRA